MNAEPQGRMGMPMRLFWCIVFFYPAAYFAYCGDYILAALTAAGGVGAFSGYRFGISYIVSSVAAFAIATVCAPKLALRFEHNLSELIGTDGLFNRAIAVGAAGIAIVVACLVLSSFVIRRSFQNHPKAKQCDNVLGFAFGFAQGVVAIVFLIGGLLVMEPQQRKQLAASGIDESKAPFAHQIIFQTSHFVDESCTGQLIRQNNPVEKIPQLRKLKELQDTAIVLADPAKMNEVIHHPSVLELREQPSVKEAIETLQQDDSIRELLASGQPMNRNIAMKLLNHPAIMHLVDQPGFIDQLSQVVSDVNLSIQQ